MQTNVGIHEAGGSIRSPVGKMRPRAAVRRLFALSNKDEHVGPRRE